MQRHGYTNRWLSLVNNPITELNPLSVPTIHIHGSHWSGLWGYWRWFMLLRVYIQALHLSCIAITLWPDLVGQKETHSRWSVWKNLLVKQMEWERVEWMEFNSGICWTWKWTFYYHGRCWCCYCVGVGASWFWPGCARVAYEETALSQPSSTQRTGY